MNEEEQQNVIAAIQTLSEDTIESWFDIKEPSFLARMAASAGFIRLPRQLDLNRLPAQFFQDVNYFTGGINTGPSATNERLLGAVRSALRNYYVTDLTDYPDEDGIRTPRLVRGSINGPGMGDIGDDVARFLLAEIPTPDLAPGMMFLQEPQIKRSLIRDNPNDPNSNFRQSVSGLLFGEDAPLQPGEKVPYIDPRTRETIMQNGDYRFEEAGNGRLNFFYRIDGLEFKYPSSKIVPNNNRYSVESDFGSRGISLPRIFANRQFDTSLLDDGNRDQMIQDKIAYINRHPIRPLVDNDENRAALKQRVEDAAARQVDREIEIRKVASGKTDLSAWEIAKGFALLGLMPTVQATFAGQADVGDFVEDALKFREFMYPGDALTTQSDVDAFERQLSR